MGGLPGACVRTAETHESPAAERTRAPVGVTKTHESAGEFGSFLAFWSIFSRNA